MNSQNDIFYFTVAQLIEILKAMPQDLPVLVSGYETGYETFYHPRVLEVVHCPENMYFDGEYQQPESDSTGDSVQAVILERMHRDD